MDRLLPRLIFFLSLPTGIELRYLDAPLFSMKQVLPKVKSVFEYNTMKMMLFQDDNWSDIDTINSSILELSLPQDTVVSSL